MNAPWVCPECDSEAHWKGLCRKCTEYNEMGIPINPIPRMRQPPTDNHPYEYILPTKESFLAQRRRKPTHKQVRAMKEAQKKHHEEYDFVEVGGEEE